MSEAAKIIDSATAPTIYVDQLVGFIMSRGNVIITFANPTADHNPGGESVHKKVALRVVIPAREAQALTVTLYEYLKEQGVDVAGTAGAMQ
ncbi:hypothetical protein RCH10_003784 [Variovorax sp. GrIS 2.14]|uniref:hypothetical protein n=1 Tax=Variovorax sp. GrIS 2.14 TaxID=3071709 RepID=UPI0038F6AAA7